MHIIMPDVTSTLTTFTKQSPLTLWWPLPTLCLQDWDQPEYIPDPDAEKPEDWDDDMDGEWEPPMIPNPEYKGQDITDIFEKYM